MAETSILSWLLMLGVFVSYVVVPFLAVRTENSDSTTGSVTFLLWFVGGYIGPPVVAYYLGTALGAPFVVAAFAVSVVTVFIVFRHFVRRARDAGLGRNIAFIAAVPLVTIGCAVFLSLLPSVPRRDSA